MSVLIEKHPDIAEFREFLSWSNHQDTSYVYLDFLTEKPIRLELDMFKGAVNHDWRNAHSAAWVEQFLDRLILWLADSAAANKPGVYALRNALLYGHTLDGWEPQVADGLVQVQATTDTAFFAGSELSDTGLHLTALHGFVKVLGGLPIFATRAHAVIEIVEKLLAADELDNNLLFKLAAVEFGKLDRSLQVQFATALKNLAATTQDLQLAVSGFHDLKTIVTGIHLALGQKEPSELLLATDTDFYLGTSLSVAATEPRFKISTFHRMLNQALITAVNSGQINLSRGWLAHLHKVAGLIGESFGITENPIPIEQMWNLVNLAISEKATPDKNTLRSPGRSSELAPPGDELDSLIGLNSIKARVGELVALTRISQLRVLHELPKLDIAQHTLFVGQPGTCKTTVARILARIYKEIGFLTSGHLVEVDRKDLVGSVVGATALQTQAKFNEAIGGVLFIDEAYSLTARAENDFGPEAIATLMKLMEDNRDNIVVIAAGYPEQMQAFVESNPGFASRFSSLVEFEAYSNAELWEIFKHMAAKFAFVLDKEIEQAFTALIPTKKDETFGNGRFVRDVFEKCVVNQSVRLTSASGSTNSLSMKTLRAADMPTAEQLKKGLKQTKNRIGFSV